MPKKKITKHLLSSFRKTFKKFWKNYCIISLKTKVLIGLGLLFIIIPIFFYVNEGIQLAFFTPKISTTPRQFASPTWISIPSVDMELPVFDEGLAHNIWGVAENGISHLDISARPGENGPIILYGHNTNNRFGPIRWLDLGAKIEISTKDKKHHFYKVIATRVVSPNEVSIVTSQKGETLILYTCDGFADLQRFIVIARPSL